MDSLCQQTTVNGQQTLGISLRYLGTKILASQYLSVLFFGRSASRRAFRYIFARQTGVGIWGRDLGTGSGNGIWERDQELGMESNLVPVPKTRSPKRSQRMPLQSLTHWATSNESRLWAKKNETCQCVFIFMVTLTRLYNIWTRQVTSLQQLLTPNS